MGISVQLECSEQNRPLLENLLISRGFVIDNNSSVIIKEQNGIKEQNEEQNGATGEGPDTPESSSKLLILSFPKDDPTSLLDFLDQISNQKSDASVPSVKENQSAEILLGKNGECFEVMKIHEIFYIFAEGDFVFCRTKSGSYEVKKKLYQLEEELGSQGFIRISKSIIINILTVSEVVPWFGGRLLLRIEAIKEKVEVSRSYVKSFKSYLGM